MVQEEWGKRKSFFSFIPFLLDRLTILRKILLLWKIRAKAIAKNVGYQMEANRHTKIKHRP